MKDKAKKIIQSALLGAIASLYASNAQATERSMPLLENLDGEDSKDVEVALRKKVYKDVLQITSNGELRTIAGHRSHSSHSSHRSSSSGGAHYSHTSHTSHYSSSSSSGSYRSSSSSSSINSNHSTSSSLKSGFYDTTTPVAAKPVKKKVSKFTLGERTLSLGLYGTDVSALTELLVQKKYLNSSWITKKNGYSVYTKIVADAVKRFQKDAGLKQDGTVTAALAEKLGNWDASKTTQILGIRDLSSKMSGSDVGELIDLLNKAGYPPDPSKLEYDAQGNAIFTADVATAVKIFQAYNGLDVTGIVEEKTVAKLKAKAK